MYIYIIHMYSFFYTKGSCGRQPVPVGGDGCLPLKVKCLDFELNLSRDVRYYLSKMKLQDHTGEPPHEFVRVPWDRNSRLLADVGKLPMRRSLRDKEAAWKVARRKPHDPAHVYIFVYMYIYGRLRGHAALSSLSSCRISHF